MAETDRVVATLERAAEQAEDITQACYERFYETTPEARQLMQHVDPHMQGRMLNEVLELLMTPPDAINQPLLQFEIRNHTGYGVASDQYRPLLDAIRSTVRSLLASDWSDADEAAWQARIAILMEQIDSACTTHQSLAWSGSQGRT